MILLLAAVSPVILFDNVLGSPIYITILANAIAVAFVICALIEIFGPVSGAHFNPVVTMALMFEKKVSAKEAAMYVVAQIAGGIAGIILTHLMFYDYIGGLLFVSDVARSGYTNFGEIIGTFVLIFAILMVVKLKSPKAPIIIGLLVGGQVMATSSTMFANPMVTIARMFTNSIAGISPLDGLIFIAMQVVGALLAYAVYRAVFRRE